ncbi:hypothetical protein ACB094_07G091300 [Castanea mollissima]
MESRNDSDQDFEPTDDISQCASYLAEEILQKYPLQKRVAEIISNDGIESIDEDSKILLSLALKIKLQGWLESALKSSKQRDAVEKARQQIVDTQDIQHLIPEVNSKLSEDKEKKQTGKAGKEFEAESNMYKAGSSSIIPNV